MTDTGCQIEFFQGPHAIKDFNLITAGGATSGAVSGLGQLYTWGQIKKVGESQVAVSVFACLITNNYGQD